MQIITKFYPLPLYKDTLFFEKTIFLLKKNILENKKIKKMQKINLSFYIKHKKGI
jgi:hypothetical protein